MTPEGDPVEVVHDQTIRVGELRISAEFGVAEDLGLSVTVPVRSVDSSIRYLAGGDEVAIAGDDVHHRNETLWGVVDPWLLAHRHLPLGAWSIDVRGGLSVPIGQTEDNPFTPEAEMRPHQHVQFGTGTFNPILGVEVGRGGTHGHILTQQVIYENDRGYMAGDRYAVGVGHTVPLAGWSLEAGADLQIESAETWDGVAHTDDGNRGRIDILLGGAVGRSLGGVDLHAGIKAPVYTHVVGGQLDYPLVVDVGISRSFELFGHEDEDEDEHEHHHDHEHEHEHEAPAPLPPPPPTLDIQDATLTGEAIPLAPVAGKITVYDFWAPWCHPCHDLDRMLRDLAGSHRDRLAIRRVNVVDWDTPAAARYLTPGGFNLPHIKVVAPDGHLLLEKSAPPHDLVHDVEALLPR